MNEETSEVATETVEEGRKPWSVLRQVPLADEEGKVHDVLQTIANGFKLQVDADAWIKENINENELLVSMRDGKAFRAQVVRKVTEV